jgi:hypothetical protein
MKPSKADKKPSAFPMDYRRLLADIKARVRAAQLEALRSVNKELLCRLAPGRRTGAARPRRPRLRQLHPPSVGIPCRTEATVIGETCRARPKGGSSLLSMSEKACF